MRNAAIHEKCRNGSNHSISENAENSNRTGCLCPVRPGSCFGTSEPLFGDKDELPRQGRTANKFTGLCQVQRKFHSPKFWGPSPPKGAIPLDCPKGQMALVVPINTPKVMLSSRFGQYLWLLSTSSTHYSKLLQLMDFPPPASHSHII